MSTRTCPNGHQFKKTSSCPVCPICSAEEVTAKYGNELPRIGAPALRALSSIGVTQLSQLTTDTEQELLALHGFGPRALRLLKERLAAEGLRFAEK